MLRVHHPADEHARQQRDEADADVVERDLVVAEPEVLEQQPQRQVRERVPNLVDEHEEQHHQRTLTPQELGERAEIRRDGTEATACGGGRGRRRFGSPMTRPTSIAGRANSAQRAYASAQPERAAITSATAPADAAPIRQPYCDMPEPTPSWRGSSNSIRYASMTMS